MHDLAEELAVDLAEAFDALAAVEDRDPLTVADEWFHDRPPPQVLVLRADPGLVLRTDPGPAGTESADPTEADPPS